jgi:hypothetical protein
LLTVVLRHVAEIQVNYAALEAMSYIIPIGIVIFGVWWAYTGFNKVRFGVV